MSATTQNSIMNLLVAKAVARTGTTALDPAAVSYLVDGEVAVVDIDGTILNSTTVLGKSKVRIVQSQGALLPSIQSPEIEKAGVKTYLGKAYTAPALQVDYIGYNSSTATGDINVINDNGYEIMIHDINSAAYGSTGVSRFGFYTSDSAATKTEIVDGLVVNLFQNTTRLVRKPFIAERVSSDAGAANTITAGADATHYTFTNGSKFVVGTDSNGVPMLGSDEVIATTVAGDYVRAGTATTVGVYKIVTVIAGTGATPAGTAMMLELDVPFQGTSATIAIGSTEYITAALFAAGSVGIKLTGLAPVFTSPQSTEYYVNRWSTNLRNFGTTTATNVTLATEGVGTYAAVASLEYFLIGNEGFLSRNDIPYVSPRASAVSTATYGFITLEWDSVKTGGIFNSQPNSKQLLIAFTDGGNREQLTGVVTSVQTVLNAWLSTFTALALA